MMIYTLTPNPAIDMNISADSVEMNCVNRTNGALYTPNGKGLNVSFVLQHYGIASKVLGFFGGFSGNYIVDETMKKGLEVLPVWVDDITRINIFLDVKQDEYKFVNKGSYVKQDQIQQMLQIIRQAKDMECLIVSGSLPDGVSDEFYDDIVACISERNIKLIIDSSSIKLKALLGSRPFLIKPNDDEIYDIFGIRIQKEEDVKEVMAYLHTLGAQNILLTMGEKGLYFSNQKALYFCNAYPIELVSSACAGDSSLASFLSIYLKDEQNIEGALKLASATGASVAQSKALGDLSRAMQYIDKVEVKEII